MPQPASQSTLGPGTVLSKRYKIEQLIGTGGYASVYRASDLTFGYTRAIKEVSDPDPGVRNQFRLEAELLINSRHPNIPHGYHLIEDMNRLFLVMDYVQGKDLEELLNESLTQRGRPLDESQVLKWAIDICGALDETHNLKVPVIHRDIKPANIKITPDGTPILIDFGLAKLHQKGPTMTAAQGVSPGFAPPEQYMAKGRTDARTDIYGLGATLYACLTGKDPPEAPARLLAQTGAGGVGMSLVAPRRMNPRVSEETDRIVMKSLELSPNNRQQSARQLTEELRSALDRLSGGSVGSTQVMGANCPRCGTQNRPDALRCIHCGALLRGQDTPARGTAGPAVPNAPGKRAIAPGPPGLRSSAKVPVPGGARGGQKSQLDDAEPRTGRQAALGLQRSAKQAAVAAEQRTGKQKAVSPLSGGAAATALVSAAPAVAATAARETAIAPLPAKAAKAAKATSLQRTDAPDATGATGATKDNEQTRAWIKLGSTPLTSFGKVMLALSFIEFVWGLLVLVLGAVAIAYRGKALPLPQLITGWVIVLVLGSIIGGQAISRPVYRRGQLTTTRRWLQGFGLVLYSVAVHGVAIWGANIFQMGQGNATLAVLSFMLFGVNVLVVGALAILNTLG